MKNIIRMGIAFVLVLFLAFVSWQIFLSPIESEALTTEEAEQVATERFEGEVIDSKLEKGIYHVSLKLETGEYEIKIASDSGDVLHVEQTKKIEDKKELTEAEIIEIIEKKDIGKIEEINKKQDKGKLIYYATVKNKKQKIKLTLNGETGEVIKETKKDLANNRNQEKKNSEETKQSKKAQKNSSKENKPSIEEKPKSISGAEAVQIALKTVSGEVDDVDLETKNGQLYYFVEIETKDDMEAEIQIHAITGEVISIEWDD